MTVPGIICLLIGYASFCAAVWLWYTDKRDRP
jgi:hypothetical protein